ncbi:hypothetical protein ACFSFY_11820 [Sporosarcina siberiensis]|uniref:Hook-length control protein FliK n=1 Tax=Sporosarcina siberiensis TaxID=1365606 RepID=A0ABW4SHU8_9BACL
MSFGAMTSVSAQSSMPAAENKPLVLKEGQLFHGQIKQLFPGQMAEVQIGGQKLYAKLEVPLKAGDSYYFQVSAVKPELQLKIISGPMSGSEGPVRQLASLMESMQLPKTAEMQELLTFVLKSKIPMTRESLMQAEALLKTVPTAARVEALATIQKMVELKVPFNESVFKALFGVESKEGLHTSLTSLKSLMVSDTTIPPQMKQAILASLETVEKPFLQATGRAALGQALLTLLNPAESTESRFATVQLLKGADVLPPSTSLANLQQVLTSLISEGLSTGQQPATQQSITQEIGLLLKQINSQPQNPTMDQLTKLKNLVASETTLSTENKATLTVLIDRMTNSLSTSTGGTKFAAEFSLALARMSSENAVAVPFTTTATGIKEQLLTALSSQTIQPEAMDKLAVLVKNAEQSNNPSVQKQLQAAEVAVTTAMDGKAIKDAIQTIVRSFGMNYEAGLLSRDANIGNLAATLKPLLLSLMSDPLISQAIKESAEMLVTRMNGPLLASSDNGVQHQLVMQIPLEFFGKKVDATLEWNGRMKENGKIDSSFARILFYLDLHSLDKTIVDMQVQNKVVTLTVYNADKDLKLLGNPMQEKLKEGLDSAGYTLSGVFFKEFYEEAKRIEPSKKQANNLEQGVDYRI